MFHEIDPDSIDHVRSMDITVVTSTKDDKGSLRAAEAPRLPLQRRTDMAKPLLRTRRPANEVQGPRLHALPGLRSSPLRLPQVRPVPHLPS